MKEIHQYDARSTAINRVARAAKAMNRGPNVYFEFFDPTKFLGYQQFSRSRVLFLRISPESGEHKPG